MDMSLHANIALAFSDPGDESLWRGILGSQGVVAVRAEADLAGCAALVADVAALAQRGMSPPDAARWMHESHPGVSLLVRVPGRAGFTVAEREWARACGIDSLLPGGTVAAWDESIKPMTERILASAGLPRIDVRALERHVRELVRRGVEPRPSSSKDIYADAYVLRTQDIDPLALHEAMQQPGGVPVEDRAFRGKTYPRCFVASEAIGWIERRYGIRRAMAETACRFLWRTGRIHHVLRDASFADDYLFFRFAGSREQLARVDLARLERALGEAGGLAIADRTWHGRTFPRCFVGLEAVEWIMRRERLPFGAAEALGQGLLELGGLRHVTGEHDFIGDNYFYRLAADERALARDPVGA